METWILLYVFVSDGGTRISTHEFEGETACLNAKEIVLKDKNFRHDGGFVNAKPTLECIPKHIAATDEVEEESDE